MAALQRAQANLKRYRASVLKAACEGHLVPTEAELARAEGRDYEPADQLLARILQQRRAHWEADQLAKMKAKGTPPQNDNWKDKYKPPAEPAADTLLSLPVGWVACTLNQITHRIGDVDHRMPKKQDSGIPYVSTKDFVEPDAIDFEGAKKIATDDFLRLSRKIKPKNGDLLISRYGTIGVVRRVTTDTPFQVSYSVAIVKPIGTRALGGYLTHALRASASQLQMRTYVRASSQPDLGLEYIRQITIALPPVAEQKRILGDLERRISMIQQLDGELATNIRRAERLRQSILKQAFEGKLVPQVCRFSRNGRASAPR